MYGASMFDYACHLSIHYFISGKENDMGIRCDIQSLPTRLHPLPTQSYTYKL